MPTFFKDELNVDIIQFTPRVDPIIGRSNSPAEGALWYDSASSSHHSVIGGIVTPVGKGLFTGSRIISNGLAPSSCNVTGAGTLGNCTFHSNSTDSFWTVFLNASGTGQAALGTFTVNFSSNLGNPGGWAACITQINDAANAWDVKATIHQTSSVANQAIFTWNNNL